MADPNSALPRVTIIIPAYNAARHLGEAVESVLAQTYPDFEVLIVDDRSTDTTFAAASKFATRDARIRVLRTEVNSGGRPAIPKNLALREARGEFVAFLDADDVWDPCKLAAQVAQMEADPGLVLSYVLFRRMGSDEPDTVLPISEDRFKGQVFKELYRRPVIPNSGVLLRRSILKEVGFLDENAAVTEDGDYWLRIARIGRIGFVPGRPLLRYRVVGGSHSSGVFHAWQRMLAVSRKHAPHAGRIAHAMNVVVFTAHALSRGLAIFRRPHIWAKRD